MRASIWANISRDVLKSTFTEKTSPLLLERVMLVIMSVFIL